MVAYNQRERKPFTNSARGDGLVLRHWRKREDPHIAALATPADSNVASEMDVDEKENHVKAESDYVFAKFNVKVTVPEYTEEQYESYLKNEDWSKEETDYLVDLAQEYDLRWVVIVDRYDYQPGATPNQIGNGDSTTVNVEPKPRSMEDMKARYYDVAAQTMALKQPLQSMSTTEFELHERMTKFDAKLETARKSLAEKLFLRPPEEVKEEEILLAELKRIVSGQEKFAQERKELYDRLQVPHSTGGTAMYKSSQELLKLMQDLLTADKNKKRRSVAGPGEGSGLPTGPMTGGSDRGPRSSLSGPGDKRGSLSGSAGPGAGHKHLSAHDEAKFGIAHHERSSTGTQFRHERINNLSKAKSNALTLRMTSAFQELGIPARLTMPTAKVCDEFEKLVQSIHTLLEVRKVSEKLEADIKVAKAQIEDQEQKEPGDEGQVVPDSADGGEDEDAEGEDDDEDDEAEPDVVKDAEEDEEEDEMEEKEEMMLESDGDDDRPPEGAEEKTSSARASETPTSRHDSVRKRSASVVSHISNKSNRSTKRQRR